MLSTIWDHNLLCALYRCQVYCLVGFTAYPYCKMTVPIEMMVDLGFSVIVFGIFQVSSIK